MYGRIFMDNIWDFAREQNLIKGNPIEPIPSFLYFDSRIIDNETYFIIKKDNTFYLKQKDNFFEFHNPDLFRFFSTKK
jgi:hypothetical protein